MACSLQTGSFIDSQTACYPSTMAILMVFIAYIYNQPPPLFLIYFLLSSSLTSAGSSFHELCSADLIRDYSSNTATASTTSSTVANDLYIPHSVPYQVSLSLSSQKHCTFFSSSSVEAVTSTAFTTDPSIVARLRLAQRCIFEREVYHHVKEVSFIGHTSFHNLIAIIITYLCRSNLKSLRLSPRMMTTVSTIRNLFTQIF